MAASKALKLNTGYMMPTVGLGCWQSPPEELIEVVKTAVRTGYRHIDTAQNYINEEAIGQALKELIDDGEIKREDIFITTKLSNSAMHPTHVRDETVRSLKALQTEYIDLYLLHGPVATSDENLSKETRTFGDMMPMYADFTPKFAFVDPLDTWKEMEKLQEDGLVRTLGVSNFNKNSFQKFYEAVKIKPANIQVECHAWFQQDELFEYCNTLGVTLSAYAPIGSPGRPMALSRVKGTVLDDPKLEPLANKYNKTKAQLLLRFSLQRGIIILPKSVKPSRIEENFSLFDFEIEAEDMETLKSMNKNLRIFNMAFAYIKGHPFFPWPEEIQS